MDTGDHCVEARISRACDGLPTYSIRLVRPPLAVMGKGHDERWCRKKVTLSGLTSDYRKRSVVPPGAVGLRVPLRLDAGAGSSAAPSGCRSPSIAAASSRYDQDMLICAESRVDLRIQAAKVGSWAQRENSLFPMSWIPPPLPLSHSSRPGGTVSHRTSAFGPAQCAIEHVSLGHQTFRAITLRRRPALFGAEASVADDMCHGGQSEQRRQVSMYARLDVPVTD